MVIVTTAFIALSLLLANPSQADPVIDRYKADLLADPQAKEYRDDILRDPDELKFFAYLFKPREPHDICKPREGYKPGREKTYRAARRIEIEKNLEELIKPYSCDRPYLHPEETEPGNTKFFQDIQFPLTASYVNGTQCEDDIIRYRIRGFDLQQRLDCSQRAGRYYQARIHREQLKINDEILRRLAKTDCGRNGNWHRC